MDKKEVTNAKYEAIQKMAGIQNKAIQDMFKMCNDLGVSYQSCRNIMLGDIVYQDHLITQIQIFDEEGNKTIHLNPK